MTDRTHLHHRRTHQLLLIQKLLSLRDNASPFTLILDSVEQSARPLISHYIHNAKSAKVHVVYVSWETPNLPDGVGTFIRARRKDVEGLRREILDATAVKGEQRTLLILDTLHPLIYSLTYPTLSPTTNTTKPTLSPAPFPSPSLPTFLSSFISPTTTLLAIYHTDIPIPSPSLNHTHTSHSPYVPTPHTLLTYSATTLLTPHSLPQTLAKKRAQERSLEIPVFGLEEGREGVLLGRGANGGGNLAMGGKGEGGERGNGEGRGIVLEMNHRRKSGRGVTETFFLPNVSPTASNNHANKPILLDDHPLYNPPTPLKDSTADVGNEEDGNAMMSTFDLGLTAKQRADREGVVLPYFDAQRGGMGGVGGRGGFGEGGGGEGRGGGGLEGGRILYDMGSEDDFDEEEDEI